MERSKGKESMSNLNKKNMIKWAINIILPLIVLMIPVSATFTPAIKTFLVITVLCVGLMATENIPIFAASLLLPVLYALFLDGVNNGVIYKPWTTDVPWLTIGGSVLTIALQKSGLLKRLAYKTILLFGANFKGMIFGMMAVGIVISAVMANLPAKAILLGAFALGICEAMDFKLGSREASALGLAAIASCLGPSYLYYTGSGGTIVTMGIAEGLGVDIPTWSEYFMHMALPQLIYTIITVIAILVLFKPEQDISSKDYIQNELKEMGKMSPKESKLAIVSALLVILIATAGSHPLNPTQLFLVVAAILMFPGINVIAPGDVKDINITPVIFITTCMTIGFVSGSIGFGGFVSNIVYPLIEGATGRVMGGLWSLGFVMNFALTPTACYSVLTEPVISMAQAAGLNPVPVIYAFVHGVEQVLLPYEYVPVLIIYGYGMTSFGSFVKYGVVRAIISFICIFAIFIPWWKIIGIF
jgi:di/tricarboxylate transporter